MNTVRSFFGLSLLASLTACGATDGSEWQETDAALEPLGESSCLTTPSDVWVDQETWQISPTTYDNPGCRKSYVFAASGSGALGTMVEWTDKHARTAAQCTGGSLTVQVMSRTKTFPVPVFYRNEGTYSAPIVFVTTATSAQCWFPKFGMRDVDGVTLGTFQYYPPDDSNNWAGQPSEIPFALPNSVGGRSLRVAAQALTPRGSTQSVMARP